MESNINYKKVQSDVARHEKGKIAVLVMLYKTWVQASNRLASMAEDNPYGATGFTVGKFIGEWKLTLVYEADIKQAVSYKKQIEAIHRVALRGYDTNTITSTTHLAELDRGDKPPKKVMPKKVAKNALLATKEFKALPKGKQAQIIAILG